MERPQPVIILLIGVTILPISVGGIAIATIQEPNGDSFHSDYNNSTEFDVSFNQNSINSIEAGIVNLTVRGVEPGSQIYIESDEYRSSTLAEMTGGNQTDYGVQVSVSSDQTIEVDFEPVACQTGTKTFHVRRENAGTNEHVSDTITVTRDDLYIQSLTRSNYTVETNSTLSVQTISNCHDFRIRFWSVTSPFNTSAFINNSDRTTTINTRTSAIRNNSQIFTSAGGTIQNESTESPSPAIIGNYKIAIAPPILSQQESFRPETGHTVDGLPQVANVSIISTNSSSQDISNNTSNETYTQPTENTSENSDTGLSTTSMNQQRTALEHRKKKKSFPSI